MSEAQPKPHTVLVVDDEALLRMDASEALQEAGCMTYEAAHAEEALRMLGEHPEITVLFTDVNMPGTRNGIVLANHVRSMWPHIHIVVVSAGRKPFSGELPENAQFLSKPWTDKQLACAIQPAA